MHETIRVWGCVHTTGVEADFQRVSSVVTDMLMRLQDEVNLYKRIVCYWTAFAPRLERMISDVIRSTVMSVSHQCGMVQVPVSGQVGIFRILTCSLLVFHVQ